MSNESVRSRLTHAGQEVSFWTSWGLIIAGQGIYDVTRFARYAFQEYPLGEFITRHAGNFGPSVNMSLTMFPIEVAKTVAERREWHRTYQALDKIAPTAVMGAVFAANYLAEVNTPNTGEKAVDIAAGVIGAAVTILTIRNTAARLRNSN